jgi:hypothetical protein
MNQNESTWKHQVKSKNTAFVKVKNFSFGKLLDFTKHETQFNSLP